jgi:hypothetical protein
VTLVVKLVVKWEVEWDVTSVLGVQFEDLLEAETEDL